MLVAAMRPATIRASMNPRKGRNSGGATHVGIHMTKFHAKAKTPWDS
jgi:hypothetical protein